MVKSYFRSKKLLWQYFFSYLLVLAIAMTTLIGFCYHNFSAFHSNMLIENYQRSLLQLRETVDSELYSLIDMATQMSASGDVLPFAYEENPEKGVQLISRIAAYQGTNRFIECMFLYFYGEDYVFSATSSYRKDVFFQDAVFLHAMSEQQMWNLMNQVRSLTVLPEQLVSGYVIASSGIGSFMMPVLVPLKYGSGARRGVAMFLINRNNYMKMFQGVLAENREVAIAGTNQVLLTSHQTPATEDDILTLTVAESGMQRCRIGSSGYYCFQQVGKIMNLRYLILVPEEELNSAVAVSVRWLMVVSVLVSAGGVLLITLFVQSRIKPIRYLHSMLSDSPPTGNELVEIQHYIQKLMDDNSALTAQINDVAVLRQSNFARNFITGRFVDANALLEGAESIGLNVDVPCYAVCILAKSAGAEYELSAEKLWHTFDGVVNGVVRPLGVEQRMVLIAFSEDSEVLQTWLKNKFDGWRTCYMGFTMSMSNIHTEWKEGSRAYLEAEQAFEYRFVQGNTQMLQFQNIENETAQVTLPDAKVMDRLRLALKSCDKSRIDRVLTDVSNIMNAANTTIFGFKCMYTEILRVITNEAIRLDMAPEQESDLFTLSRCLSLEELDGMLRRACYKLVEHQIYGEAPSVDMEDSLSQAREIMAQRFAETDISVAQISEEVGIPTSRFAVLFKERYGLTPLECLTEYRINRARYLLENTQMVVKDVALECGYYDISTFNRRFKASTGKTPNQYRIEIKRTNGEE